MGSVIHGLQIYAVMSRHKIYKTWSEHTVLLISLLFSDVFVAIAAVVCPKTIIRNSKLAYNVNANNEICGEMAANYEIQKPSTCRATLFRCKFWWMFHIFHAT